MQTATTFHRWVSVEAHRVEETFCLEEAGTERGQGWSVEGYAIRWKGYSVGLVSARVLD